MRLTERIISESTRQVLSVAVRTLPGSGNWGYSGQDGVPQSAPGLVFADCIELLHLWLQRI